MFEKALIGLAPMAGITDPPLRILSYKYGADYACTEMVSAMGLMCAKPNNSAYQLLLTTWEGESNTAVQLFGSDPMVMGEASAKITAMKRFSSIDINMGCPARKVVSTGEGSSLLLDPDRAARIMEAVKVNTILPVTVKTRLGYDEQSMNALALAQAAQQYGLRWICIHGRTKAQMYSGKADYEAIGRIRAKVKIPVIANGDVFSVQDAQRILSETGAAGLLIGRGIMGNPQLFREIHSLVHQGTPGKPASLSEKLETALEHTRLKILYEGEKVGVMEMRTHLGHYIAGMRGAAALRGSIGNVRTLQDVEKMIRMIRDENVPKEEEK